MTMSRQDIYEHEGRKYLREIASAERNVEHTLRVDVYCVLNAFEVTNPAIAHAVKKLLCAGLRDKGSYIDDLKGVLAAVNRAIDMEEQAQQRAQK